MYTTSMFTDLLCNDIKTEPEKTREPGGCLLHVQIYKHNATHHEIHKVKCSRNFQPCWVVAGALRVRLPKHT